MRKKEKSMQGRVVYNFMIKMVATVCFVGILSTPHVSPAKPISIIENDSYDFGSVFEGVDIIHDYVIKNTGETGLKIEKVESG
jgi:hypothetical protein